MTEDTSKIDPKEKINKEPIFKDVAGKQLPDLECRLNEPCDYELPEVIDPDEDPVEITINMGHAEFNAASVLSFDKSANIVSLTFPNDF